MTASPLVLYLNCQWDSVRASLRIQLTGSPDRLPKQYDSVSGLEHMYCQPQ